MVFIKTLWTCVYDSCWNKSSAATLPVSLKCVRKSGVLDEEITNFAIPLGATTHLCGSVLTETFFVMVVSKILYGAVPPFGTMVLLLYY